MADRCRAFKFLLQPTTRQRAAMERLVAAQRELYNAALEERRGAWVWERRSVTKYEQFRTLTELRDVRPDVLEWGVTVCRGTLTRLDEAFRAFYRRSRTGETPGFPRFKGISRWGSAQWSDRSGWTIDETSRRLRLHGVGAIAYRRNRPLRGIPKTITVRREQRRWFVVVFCTDVPAEALPKTGHDVGLDLGVNHLATTSDGHHLPNHRPARRAQHRLAAAQQALARKKIGGANRRRIAKRVGAVHRKVARQRLDHAHKVSRALIDKYDLLVHEDLPIPVLTRRPSPRPDGKGGYEPNGASAKAGLNRSILDAGWGLLLRMIAYKAEDAGRTVIAVSAAYSSQTCHACGHVAKGNRRAEVFRCLACGHTDDADINAARNILRAGRAQRERSREAEQAA